MVDGEVEKKRDGQKNILDCRFVQCSLLFYWNHGDPDSSETGKMQDPAYAVAELECICSAE